jgi:PEP-CTERM motif
LSLLLSKNLFILSLTASSLFAGSLFTVGNLVVTVEGNGVQGAASGPYTDNMASPLTLFQFKPSGTASANYVNSLVLPQTASGANFAVSSEYGSSSEGTLQLSGNGQFLTVGGYGINAATFNANPGSFSPDPTNIALGQSGSQTGQGYTPVSRVVALIDANGTVNSTTGLYNIFNANNPRSAYTTDGKTIYVSGQGTKGDNTGGVFVTQVGSTSAVSVTGNDAGVGASQETRVVQIYNGTLYVSSDSKVGSTNRDFIGTLGTAGTPPTGLANGGNGPTSLNGFGNSGGTGKLTVTAATANGINSIGSVVNLSPEGYFFANASTLYVADSGSPKNNSGTSALGDGGLQKWVNSAADGSGIWSLEYTLSNGLGLVANSQADNPSGDDTTGLYGLTGQVVGGQVLLYATNYTIGDVDPTFLFGITDSLTATAPAAGESFSVLAAAPADSNFKGVSFAPTAVAVPEPTALALLALGLIALLTAKVRSYRKGLHNAAVAG